MNFQMRVEGVANKTFFSVILEVSFPVLNFTTPHSQFGELISSFLFLLT